MNKNFIWFSAEATKKKARKDERKEAREDKKEAEKAAAGRK